MKNLSILSLCALLWAPSALAHHGSSTSRISQNPGHALGGHHGRGQTSLVLGLESFSSYFGRVLRDRAQEKQVELGSVFLNQLSLGLGLSLASNTTVGLKMPLGYVEAKPGAGQKTKTAFGLGDLQLYAAQDLLSMLQIHSPLTLRLQGGLILPTGRYEADNQLRATEVRPADGGQILVTTYNAQTSLGADSWSIFLGLSAGLPLGSDLRLEAMVGSMLPLSRTDDAMRWGWDLYSQIGAAWAFWGPLEGGLAVVYRHHGKDNVPIINETTKKRTGFEGVGGRDDLGLGVKLDARITEALGCGIKIDVPLWQRAGDVQLVETLSGGLHCSMLIGLLSDAKAAHEHEL